MKNPEKSGDPHRSDPQPEDLASREDLLLAYDRLSREGLPVTSVRGCNTESDCTVFETVAHGDLHSFFPEDMALLREDA